MPTDAIILSLIVLVFFASFGAVLLWADFRTRPDSLKQPDFPKQRRRAFWRVFPKAAHPSVTKQKT